MAKSVNPPVQTSVNYPNISKMENILKDLFNNAEDKLSCFCLLQESMKVPVIAYFRQIKPWLIQSELEKRADILIRTAYQNYIREKNNTFNVLRRSFRRVITRQTICNCSCRKSETHPTTNRNKSRYSELREPFSNECNCHITCEEQYKSDDILRPLERFIVMNRSFRLKLKHLDNEKYGYLDTSNSNKITKPQEEDVTGKCAERLVLSSPNRSFQVKLEDTSTPSSSQPKYQFHFKPKSSTVTQDVGISSNNNTKCIGKENVSNNMRNIKQKLKSLTKRPTSESEQKNNCCKDVVVKLMHCENHCFLCCLAEESKLERQVVYCENHCPKCIISKKKLSCSHDSDKDVKVVRSCNGRVRSKSETRIPKVQRRTPNCKNASVSFDDKKRAKTNEKVQKDVKDGITLLERNMDELNISFGSDPDWESRLDELGNAWASNTIDLLDEIRDNHLEPLKTELSDMDKHLRYLRRKYK